MYSIQDVKTAHSSLGVDGIIKRIVRPYFRLKFFDRQFSNYPEQFRDASVCTLGHPIQPGYESEVVRKVESRRSEIASGTEPVDIYYSPKPRQGETTEPGEIKQFSPEKIADTGASGDKGRVLYRLAAGSNATQVLELGTCVGISAAYIAGAPSVESIKTVEASEDLASIAEETLSNVDVRTDIRNQFFEDALSEIEGEFDFAFIDGHHEKEATLHYYQDVKSHFKRGSIVVFDDIYWSKDMNDCWQELRSLSDFSHTLDLGWFGACIFDPYQEGEHYDITKYTGRNKIGEPDGWSGD